MSRLSAYRILGYHALRTAARRLFGERRGLAAFLDNYRDDRLPPLTADEHALLGAFDSCLSCGLCDTLARPMDRADPERLAAPSALPASVSRHPPDYEGARPYLARLEEEDLVRMEAICPSRIPFRRLVQMIHDVIARQGARQAAP